MTVSDVLDLFDYYAYYSSNCDPYQDSHIKYSILLEFYKLGIIKDSFDILSQV
jgi:hypothetical protein